MDLSVFSSNVDMALDGSYLIVGFSRNLTHISRKNIYYGIWQVGWGHIVGLKVVRAKISTKKTLLGFHTNAFLLLVKFIYDIMQFWVSGSL